MKSRSLAARGALAVVLMIGFYALALAMILVLLFIPYAEVAFAHRLHLKLAIGCLFGAGAIAWAILPRFDRFEAPGPLLRPGDHPKLFERITEIAARSAQSMPEHVYLVPQVNAWVANRGGLMGFGSHRVMGLGLPLMQITTVSEFEAILAHEFGHYHGGDTRLGPWIYKTRSAIARTLSGLGQRGILHLPFQWYGTFFLKITQAISRAQELTADRLAATLVGSRPLVDGLRRVHGEGMLFPLFWQQEMLPVLRAGFRAPMLDGFRRFLGVPRVREAVERGLGAEIEGGRADPLDSHPPLRERIAAVADLEKAGAASDERPSIDLLGDPERCEESLLAFLNQTSDVSSFAKISWPETGTKVYGPIWRAQAEKLVDLTGEWTLARLPELIDEKAMVLAHRITGNAVPADRLADALVGPLGAAVATALLDAGWEASTDVGEPITFRGNGHVLDPFAAISRLLRERSRADEWRHAVAAAGVADLRMAAA